MFLNPASSNTDLRRSSSANEKRPGMPGGGVGMSTCCFRTPSATEAQGFSGGGDHAATTPRVPAFAAAGCDHALVHRARRLHQEGIMPLPARSDVRPALVLPLLDGNRIDSLRHCFFLLVVGCVRSVLC